MTAVLEAVTASQKSVVQCVFSFSFLFDTVSGGGAVNVLRQYYW